MDEIVQRAMQRWPDVPAVYGWLSLDARGEWRLRGEPIPNRALVEFIRRNYGPDERGRWFFQNGPQRVFVELDYAPRVFALDGAGRLEDHCGGAVRTVSNAWLDEAGRFVLDASDGPGLVDDRALLALSDHLVDASGAAIDEEVLASGIERGAAEGAGIWFEWEGERIPVGVIDSEALPARLGFVRTPEPD